MSEGERHMETSVTALPGKPGSVIFVAILNFISAACALSISFLLGLILVFGNLIGLKDYAADRAVEFAPSINWPTAMNLFVGFFTTVSFLLGLGYLFLGIGLLSGKGWSWYVQIALAVIGLLFPPIGTIVSLFVLAFFFQSETRTFFKV